MVISIIIKLGEDDEELKQGPDNSLLSTRAILIASCQDTGANHCTDAFLIPNCLSAEEHSEVNKGREDS